MLERREQRKIIQFVRVFSDGDAELLQGKLLQDWLERMKIIENMLETRGDVDLHRTSWMPIEKFKIKQIKLKTGAGR